MPELGPPRSSLLQLRSPEKVCYRSQSLSYLEGSSLKGALSMYLDGLIFFAASKPLKITASLSTMPVGVVQEI